MFNAILNDRSFVAFVGGFALLLTHTVGCSNYGKKLEFNQTEVYYDDKSVTEEDATRLGKYLEESSFADGTPKSVQLVKEGGKWQFRMVTQDSYIKDEEYHDIASIFAQEISRDVFNGATVEVHLCDERLKTKKIIHALPSFGMKYTHDGTDIYYDGEKVTESDAKELGEFLESSEFTDGRQKSVQLAKPEDTWQFRMVSAESYFDDEEFHETFALFGSQLSEGLFAGAEVEMHLCDEYFRTKKVVPMKLVD